MKGQCRVRDESLNRHRANQDRLSVAKETLVKNLQQLKSEVRLMPDLLPKSAWPTPLSPADRTYLRKLRISAD